uniref:hypothetical protein n=1 Tax=Bacillus cytotoxicus TaxID=580165 RepID=UPI00203A8552
MIYFRVSVTASIYWLFFISTNHLVAKDRAMMPTTLVITYMMDCICKLYTHTSVSGAVVGAVTMKER